MCACLDNVLVEKNGSTSGRIVFFGLLGSSEIEFRVAGSFPISRSPTPPTETDALPPDRLRQHMFEAIVHGLRLAFDGQVAPYKFQDRNGDAYYLDSKATAWLINSGRWEPTRRDGSDGLMLRPM